LIALAVDAAVEDDERLPCALVKTASAQPSEMMVGALKSCLSPPFLWTRERNMWVVESSQVWPSCARII